MGHPSVDELRALLASDEARFAEVLGRHPWFPIYPFVELLQARPELAAAVRAHVPDHRLESFDAWMTRRVLPLDRHDLPEFARLATEVAREHDPDFPALPGTRPPWVSSHVCAGEAYADLRDADGRGWELRIESADEGPAETRHIEHWTATAHGADFIQVVRLDSSNSRLHVWADPLIARPG